MKSSVSKLTRICQYKLTDECQVLITAKFSPSPCNRLSGKIHPKLLKLMQLRFRCLTLAVPAIDANLPANRERKDGAEGLGARLRKAWN
jgi:hypothetical protein